MNSKTKILIILFIPIIYYSCNKRTQEVKGFDINPNHYNEGDYQLSKTSDSIDYVFLETCESNFIGSIGTIKTSSNYIILTDRITNKVFAFSRNGKFLFTISRQGKGPGEYLKVDDIIIDENHNCVYLSSGQSQLLKYSLDNKYLETIKLDVGPRFVKLTNNGFLSIVKCPNTKMYSGYTFNFLSSSGKLVNQQIKHDISEFSGSEPLSFSSIYSINDTLCLWEAYFDTIYCVTNNNIVVPRWSLNGSTDKITNKEIMSPKSFNSAMDRKFTILSFIECPSDIFLKVSYKGNQLSLIYNKISDKYIKLTSDNSSKFALLRNDIDMCINYWPTFSSDNNTTLMVINPNDFKLAFHLTSKSYPNSNFVKKYSLKVENIKEFDNPILFIVKHK